MQDDITDWNRTSDGLPFPGLHVKVAVSGNKILKHKNYVNPMTGTWIWGSSEGPIEFWQTPAVPK